MYDLQKFVSQSVGRIREQRLDDAIDRLNYAITTVLLAVFAIIIGGKQYFGTPIQCMMPAEFSSTNWEKYAENICFTQGTYSHPLYEELPQGPRNDQQIVGYYQWVPFIFLMQALFFYLPNFIWRTLQRQNGMDQKTIVAEAINLRCVFGQQREDRAIVLTAYIGDCLRHRSLTAAKKESFNCSPATPNGLSTTAAYFLIKFLYLINVIVQFFLVNEVVGGGNAFWGWEVLERLSAGGIAPDSGLFPRVTLCDYRKPKIGDVLDITVQCILMMNMLNEKLFLILWFWFLFLALCTLVGFVYLLVTMLPPYFRERRVRHFLGAVDLNNYSGRQLRQFLYVNLGLDGLLLLRFIEQHAGALVARQIASHLWHRYHLPAQCRVNMPAIECKIFSDDDGNSIKLVRKN